MWYKKIDPSLIKRKIFSQKRPRTEQEKTRQIICKSLVELDNNFSTYGAPYTIIIPQKTWDRKKIGDFQKIAENNGGHMADWIELALSWAYQLSFDTSWLKLCCNPDTANWYRTVIWEDKKIRLVGGSINYANDPPPSYIHDNVYSMQDVLSFCVPIIVKR